MRGVLSGQAFLGIEWSWWKLIGWFGNVAFFSRFIIQWYASERRGRVVVPISFWWLSLVGSLLLTLYAVYRQDSVFIFAYGFTWFPYVRNLVLERRQRVGSVQCEQCQKAIDGPVNYCPECGEPLNELEGDVARGNLALNCAREATAWEESGPAKLQPARVQPASSLTESASRSWQNISGKSH